MVSCLKERKKNLEDDLMKYNSHRLNKHCIEYQKSKINLKGGGSQACNKMKRNCNS